MDAKETDTSASLISTSELAIPHYHGPAEFTNITMRETTTTTDYVQLGRTVKSFLNKSLNGTYGADTDIDIDTGTGTSTGTPGTLPTLPPQYTVVSAEAWNGILVYSFIFIVAAVGNITVFIFLIKLLQRRRSPMYKLLLHLNIADLLVVFIIIPSEIGWRLSIGWYAGGFSCKLVQFIRAFGLYLSSLIVICISMDRYYAVLYPLRSLTATKRVKTMIYGSWIGAAICSIPQCMIFRVASHPDYSPFLQCVSDNFGVKGEIANGIFNIIILYFLPLLFIVYAYGSILRRISKSAIGAAGAGVGGLGSCSSNLPLRRTGPEILLRARTRTTLLTVGIIMVFLICWTPYVVIVLWELIDRESLVDSSSYLQDFLLTMVVANSTVNPLVYGCLSRKPNRRAVPRGRESNRTELQTFN